MDVVVVAVSIVDGPVADHAFGGEPVAEREREFDALPSAEVVRERDLELAGELRVAGALDRLDLVPEGRAVGEALGGAVGQHDALGDETVFTGVVVHEAVALVLDLRARAVGCGGDRRAARRAGGDLYGHVVHGHKSSSFPATWPRRATPLGSRCNEHSAA